MIEKAKGSNGLGFIVERDEGRATLRVRGEVDISSADALEQRIDQLRNGDFAELVIDLASVPFMDSSGLRVLLKAHSELQEAGGRLLVAQPSTAVARLFEVSGLDTHFERIEEPPGQ